MFLSPKRWARGTQSTTPARAQSTRTEDSLRSRERNRVIDGDTQTTEGAIACERSDANIRQPCPSRARQPVCVPSDARILGRSSGSWALAFRRPTWRCFPGTKPSAIRAVRSQLPLRGSPGMRASKRGHRVPFSADPQSLGAGTENGHKILWLPGDVNTIRASSGPPGALTCIGVPPLRDDLRMAQEIEDIGGRVSSACRAIAVPGRQPAHRPQTPVPSPAQSLLGFDPQ